MTIPVGSPSGTSVKRRVAILTAAPLSLNPRALKEAETIRRAGFEVVVYGASYDEGQRETDERIASHHSFFFRSVLPVGEDKLKWHPQSVWRRIRTRAGVDLNRYLHIENSWQLGTAIVQLEKEARKAESDYYIAHLEQGAWVGARLHRSGSRVGIDMEDWYSEDLTPEARKSRPLHLLRDLERELLTSGAHATCPSHAMSEALAGEFGCPQPTVVYNAFPWSDRAYMDGLSKDRRHPNLPSIHWFSQTLGRGRGLEDLISALPLLKHDAEIHLRGKPISGFDAWLANRLSGSWHRRIVVHPLVSNTELLSRIAEHDIGFAGETTSIRSRDLTVTNKILYYLLAGLAVVASETAGQREVATQAPGGVSLYPPGDVPALAARLNTFLGSADALKQAKNAALAAAEKTFCWERQEKALLESIKQALGSPNT